MHAPLQKRADTLNAVLTQERSADAFANDLSGTSAAQCKRAETMERSALQRKLVQRSEALEEEEPLQGKFAVTQLANGLEEEEPLQGKFERVTGSAARVQRRVDPTTEVNGVPVNDDPALEQEADVMGAKAAQFVPATETNAPVQREAQAPNTTGMSDNLKAGIENLSGMSMDAVKVHYNSDKPAQLNALAYTQGTDIHVGPGQEQHVPHEAWHVVQQADG
jgi:Domain of unknown function (DUF4157)